MANQDENLFKLIFLSVSTALQDSNFILGYGYTKSEIWLQLLLRPPKQDFPQKAMYVHILGCYIFQLLVFKPHSVIKIVM